MISSNQLKIHGWEEGSAYQFALLNKLVQLTFKKKLDAYRKVVLGQEELNSWRWHSNIEKKMGSVKITKRK